MIAVLGVIASVVLFIGSFWAVFSKCIHDGILMKKGLIVLAFGSCANAWNPSFNAQITIIVSLAFILTVLIWKVSHNKVIFKRASA